MGSRKLTTGKASSPVAAAPAPARVVDEQLELYRRIFATSADAIAVIAPDGHYLEQNPAHHCMTGYSDEELEGKTPAVHLGEEAFARIAAALQAEGSYRGQHVSRSKSGTERTIELTAFSVRNGQGEIVCHVGIKRDISERRRAEEETRARVRQQAAVAELGGRALAGLDLGALMQDAAGLVATALPADVTLTFEVEPDGQRLRLRAACGCDVSSPALRENEDPAAAFAVRHREPVVFENLAHETRFTTATLGAWGAASGMYVVIRGRESPLGVLGARTRSRRTFTQEDLHFLRAMANILAVVMQRQLDEEVLQRAEKLAMLGRMAAAVAHEINNPLESVTNLLYLLETDPGLAPIARGYARMAHQELERVSHVARQTLSFYRESPTVVPVDMAELLDSLLQLHARRMHSGQIQVERRFEFHGSIPAFPAEMRQVFSNLILNALDAAGRSGRLCLHVYEGREWRDGRRGVRVLVADNGAGITGEHRARLFEPFFTTKGDKGTGLGLWVSNGIVQKHGGRIRVRSSARAGRSGTIFSVFLPRPAEERGQERAT